MARRAVAMATVLLHTLLGMVCAMPGPVAPSRRSGGGPRLQCASCLLPFGSAKAVRIHQAAMGPASPCGSQRLPPVTSGWSGSGPRAAGRVEDLSGQRGPLSCASDSESETNTARSSRGMEDDIAEQEDPVAEQEDPVAEQEDPAPAEPEEPMDQVKYLHIRTIHTYTYIYILNIHIHTYTYTYIRIL